MRRGEVCTWCNPQSTNNSLKSILATWRIMTWNNDWSELGYWTVSLWITGHLHSSYHVNAQWWWWFHFSFLWFRRNNNFLLLFLAPHKYNNISFHNQHGGGTETRARTEVNDEGVVKIELKQLPFYGGCIIIFLQFVNPNFLNELVNTYFSNMVYAILVS